MKVELELPEFPGFEYTGEYRPYKNGEWFYCAQSKKPRQALCDSGGSYPIFRKLPIEVEVFTPIAKPGVWQADLYVKYKNVKSIYDIPEVQFAYVLKNFGDKYTWYLRNIETR